MSRLYLLITALLFSTGGVVIKSSSLNGWQVASFRSGIAALFLLLVLPGARQWPALRDFSVAMFYAGTLLLFVLANKLTTSANAIFLQSTSLLYVLLLGPRVLGERTRARDYAIIAFVALGMSMFFLSQQDAQVTAPNPLAGNILGAFSGLTWAITILGLRRMERTRSRSDASMTAIVTGNLLVFLLGLPLALQDLHPQAYDLLSVLYLGAFQIGAAYIFLTRGLRAVPALQASMLLLVEPALNPLWTWLVLHEHPGNWTLAGGTIILAATAANALNESQPG